MPYSVDRFQNNSLDNGRFPLLIPDNTINSTATPLKLLGRSVPNYGEHVAETLVWMLENFAGANAPANPLTGQYWWQTDGTPGTGRMFIWDGVNWKQVSTTSTGSGFPASPQEGDLSFVDGQLYYWDGSKWNLAGGALTTPSQPNPADSVQGQLWWNNATGKLYGFDSNRSAWILVGPGAVTASSAPPSPSAGNQEGDFWFDTSTNTFNVWNGSEWQGLAKMGVGSTLPPSGDEGELFWDQSAQKLWGYSTSDGWVLVGPGGVESGTSFPTAPQIGQNFFNVTEQKLYAYGGSGPGWVHVGPGATIRSDTAPTSPVEGDLWHDTSIQKTFVWNGDAGVWQNLGGTEYGSTPPSSPQPGDLWFDTNDNVMKVWDGTNFVVLPNTPTTQPANPSLGDTWYDQADSALKFWNGTDWAFIARDGLSAGGLTGAAASTVVNNGIDEPIVRIDVDGQLMGIWSEQTMSNITAPADVVAEFPSGLVAGLNMARTSVSGVFAGPSDNVAYGDLAERYHADNNYDVGTVLAFGGTNEVTLASENSVDVAGVVSDSYGPMLLNSDAGPDETHPPVGIVGRVKCKVKGMVSKHDRMIAAGDGFAQASSDMNFAVFAHALEDHTSSGEGLIWVALTRK